MASALASTVTSKSASASVLSARPFLALPRPKVSCLPVGSGDLITDPSSRFDHTDHGGTEATVACGVNNNKNNHTQEILITSADNWAEQTGFSTSKPRPLARIRWQAVRSDRFRMSAKPHACVIDCLCVCARTRKIAPFPKIHQVLHSYRPRPDNDPATSKSFVLVK